MKWKYSLWGHGSSWLWLPQFQACSSSPGHLSLIFSVILFKKKYRNSATKERRKAIKEFSMKKTDDLKQKPWEFFKTFWPFLGKSKGSNTISLETEENSVETDESIISNKFAHYFTNIASTIGGNHVLDLSEDHKNHASINPVRKEQLDINFKFQPITEPRDAKMRSLWV